MASSKPKSKTSKSPSFYTQLEELEVIIQQFETEDIELEESVEAFEKGLKLIELLKAQLEQAEHKVEKIKRQFSHT